MGNAQEDFPGLSVTLSYEGFQGFGETFVSGLVTLDNLADCLVEDEDVIVLIEDSRREVMNLTGIQPPVFHLID